MYIPPSDIHSYYYAKLLRDVTKIEERLLLNLAIPYTAFVVSAGLCRSSHEAFHRGGDA